MAEMLIEQGADVNEVYEPEGWTALGIAMNNGNLQCVQVLLQNDVSLDQKNRDGMTPVESAKYYLSTYTDPTRQVPAEVTDVRGYREQGIAQWEAVIGLLEAELNRRQNDAIE